MALYDDGVGDVFAPSPRGRARRRLPVPNELTNNSEPFRYGTRYSTPTDSDPDPYSDTLFDDPYTAQLERIARGQIAELSQPWSDPGFDDVVNLIKSRVGAMNSGGNPLLGDFIHQGRQRIAELNQEPFSAQEEDRLRTRAVQGIEAERTAARERALQDVARRGLGESSGVLQELYSRADRSAEAGRTRAETDLAMYITGERQRRRSEATGIAQALAGAGAQDAAQRDARNSQIMSAAGMLANLAAQRRGEVRARQNDVLAIASALAQLPVARMQQIANTVLGLGGANVGNVFSDAISFANTAQRGREYRDDARANLIEGLGRLIGYIESRSGRSGG